MSQMGDCHRLIPPIPDIFIYETPAIVFMLNSSYLFISRTTKRRQAMDLNSLNRLNVLNFEPLNGPKGLNSLNDSQDFNICSQQSNIGRKPMRCNGITK